MRQAPIGILFALAIYIYIVAYSSFGYMVAPHGSHKATHVPVGTWVDPSQLQS